ncbi:Ger(x)C family spore germination protein [Ornithinibacillus scapharcae]|uniref:Ger(x)C family spore germination protein n=1 Tax=Ornithinibacillus scapharcae TaxID=1147159 RepID=UPI000225BD47|nr:Ger(x)C family spore germination protein [Ornithinibacillus scapharcae]
MMRRILPLSIFVWTVLLTTGCNDIKEIQEKNYATAIGIDYQDNQYVTYVQLVSLTSLSNVEGATTEMPDIWVSQSTGNTLNDALYALYNTAQERIIWSHVSSIILTESAIENGFKGIFDGIIRYNEFRLTPWVFGTKGEMKEILSTQGFYNKGALETILHNPKNIYKQYSLVRPIALHRLAREAFEPAFTTYLPSIAVNEEQWVKNEENDPKLMYDGAFFMEGEAYKGFFPLEELKGAQWITADTERTSLTIQSDELGGHIFIVIEDLKTKLKANVNGGLPDFELSVDIKGYVSNQNDKEPLPIDTLTDEIKETIKKEIYDLYRLSVERQTDMFNFEHELFRQHTNYWKDNVKENDLNIPADILKKVNIKVGLRHAGAGKSN